MARRIQLKRSNTTGDIPTTADIVDGELALNTYDGKIFLRTNKGGVFNIIEFISSNSSSVSPSNPTTGTLWFDTNTNTLKVWDGANWVGIGGPATQSTTLVSSTPPTTRSDGGTLQVGDTYYDNTTNTTYIWDGSSWNSTGGDGDTTNVVAKTTAPTTREDGNVLQNGDTYYNTSTGVLYVWDVSENAWVSVGGLAAQSYFTDATVAPSTRDDGSALVTGDTYYNTSNGSVSVWDGAAWVDIAQDTSSVTISGGSVSGVTLSSTSISNTGNITSTGNSTFGDAASDTHTFNGDADFNHNLNVDGTTTLDNTNIVGSLNVTGDASVDNLLLDGNTITTSSGSLVLNSTSGTTQINDNLDLNGNADVSGTLDVTGNSTLGGDLVVTGDASVNGNTTLGNAAGDSHTVNGNADFNNDLNVDGKITLGPWSIEVDGSGNLVFKNGTSGFKVSSTGAIEATNDISAYGTL